MTHIRDTPTINAVTDTPAKLHGIIAEFQTVNDIMHAARKTRDEGFKCWDVHTPFAVQGIDEVMGIRPMILPWIVLLCGLVGVALSLSLTIGTMTASGIDLPSLAAFIPVVFVIAILLSAFGAVFGMLLLNRLPKLYNPLFKSRNFRQSTVDRFFIEIQARDVRFDKVKTAEFFQGLGAMSVELIED